MRLDKLFDVKSGISTSELNIRSASFQGSIPFLRPSKTQQRTISGWVSKSEVGSCNIFPENTLFVSTNGEGSHSYAYVSRFEFSCNSDVSVLIPKKPMSVIEKIFYAKAITLNRYKFSYGRKPKGERLKEIILPESFSSHFDDMPIGDIDTSTKTLVDGKSSDSLKIESWHNFPLSKLFTIETCKCSNASQLNPGNDIFYVGAKKKRQWIDETSWPRRWIDYQRQLHCFYLRWSGFSWLCKLYGC